MPWQSLRKSAIAYLEAEPLERIAIVRRGVPAVYVETVVRSADITKERLYRTLGLGRATIDRKLRKRVRLSREEGERVLAFSRTRRAGRTHGA